MNLPVEFLSGADADLQAAFNRFEDYREGFAAEFMAAVDAHLARRAAFPLLAALYHKTVRRQVLVGFPCGLFYEPHPTPPHCDRHSAFAVRPGTDSATT